MLAQGIANTSDIVILIRQYPRDNQGDQSGLFGKVDPAIWSVTDPRRVL
jgi:hypothetical protein